MINELLPRRSERRFFFATLFQALRGRADIRQRFVEANWRTFRRYRKYRFKCNVCEMTGTPFFDFPNLALRQAHGIGTLRETMQCRRCGSTMRHRTLASAVLRVISDRSGQQVLSVKAVTADVLGTLRILDSDAFSPISEYLGKLPGYVVSSYVPSQPFDIELAPGHVNLNLERIGFPASRFDIILTSDVMEHVRNIEAAHDEISRVLAPAGKYIFTLPYDATIDSHRLLVDTTSSEDVFLVPPHYHGDPLSGGILAYRIFGRQIKTDLGRRGLTAELYSIDDTGSFIVGGDVFIASKAIAPTDSEHQPSCKK